MDNQCNLDHALGANYSCERNEHFTMSGERGLAAASWTDPRNWYAGGNTRCEDIISKQEMMDLRAAYKRKLHSFLLQNGYKVHGSGPYYIKVGKSCQMRPDEILDVI